MPLALSVHNFISSVGADAGFASIIGLAVLVLLYFAHAKDTANLQQEADELAHRLLQAETRLSLLWCLRTRTRNQTCAISLCAGTSLPRSCSSEVFLNLHFTLFTRI